MTDENKPVQIEAVDFRASTVGATTGRRMGCGGLLIGLLFLLLAVVAATAWWVFTGPTLRVTVDPEPDSLVVEGGLYRFGIGDEWLVGPGSITVSAEKVGYEPVQQTVRVNREDAEVLLQLVERPGVLSIQVQPAVDAVITLGEAELGTAPIKEHPVAGGTYRLVATADRYQVAETNLTVEGKGVEQDVTLTLVPGWADLQVDATPGTARVRLDGADMGAVPITRELDPGSVELLVEAPGYKSFQTQLVVEANVPIALTDLALPEADGVLMLSSQPGGALLTVDGVYRGKTPATLELSSGEDHNLVLARAGYRSHEETIRLQPLQTNQLDVVLDPVLAPVRFEIEPAGTTLEVDGTSVGATPDAVEWTTVEHRVIIRKDGYTPYETTVTPRVGIPQVVRATLEEVQPEPVETATTPTPSASEETVPANKGKPMMLVRIPPGTMRMGSGRREQGRRSNETYRDVVITKPYWIGSREVSNAEFRAFRSNHHSGSLRQFSLNLDDQPVANVTWEDAAAYCNWLSKREGYDPVYRAMGNRWVADLPLANGYRLPTEAEWAYAARNRGDGKPARYSWGGGFPPQRAVENLADESIEQARVKSFIRGYNDGATVSAPVASFPAMANGLHDIGGNVAEWVHDHYTIHPYMPGTVIRDPVGPDTGKFHTIRGPSWRSSGISDARLSFRDYGNEERDDVGFRVCRTADK